MSKKRIFGSVCLILVALAIFVALLWQLATSSNFSEFRNEVIKTYFDELNSTSSLPRDDVIKDNNSTFWDNFNRPSKKTRPLSERYAWNRRENGQKFFCPEDCRNEVPKPDSIAIGSEYYDNFWSDFYNWEEQKIYDNLLYICEKRKKNLESIPSHKNVKTVKIGWTSALKTYTDLHAHEKYMKNCEVPVVITSNLEDAHVIVIEKQSLLRTHYREKKPNQLIVFLYAETTIPWTYKEELNRKKEPPENQLWLHFSDWIIHWNPYSDIPWGFFRIFEENKNPNPKKLMEEARKSLANKNKQFLAISLISHCTYPRSKYIDELTHFGITHLNVGKKCTFQNFQKGKRFDYVTKKQIIQNYKFYYAFENCQRFNYMGQKLGHGLFDQVNSIPIYFGAQNARDLFPDVAQEYLDRMFINSDDFDGPGHLAEYLRYLDKNNTAYLEYFEWKIHISFKSSVRTCQPATESYFGKENMIFCLLSKHYRDGNEVCEKKNI